MVGTTCGKRLGEIDFLKTAAAFWVIVIHTSSAGYAAPLGSFDWLSSVFWGAASRAAVPVFFLCSGILFFDPTRELSLKKLFGKYILRIVVAMLFWGLFYKIFHLTADGKLTAANLLQAGKEVLLFRQEFHLYFLHMILLFYVMAPVVRRFLAAAAKKQMQYALAIWFMTGIVYPTVRGFWPFALLGGIPAQWLLNMTWASLGYGIMGYYLHRFSIPLWCSVVLTVGGFLFTFGGTVAVSLAQGTLYQGLLEGMSLGPAFMAAGSYGIGKWVSTRLPLPCAAFTQAVSRASFCVYLIHVFFLRIMERIGLTGTLFAPLAAIPLLAAVNLLLSYGVYWVLRKVPWVNRWLI